MKQLTALIEHSGLSITGPVREDNQDTILLPNKTSPGSPKTLYAVADGMGGYAHGGMASALALEILAATLSQAPHLAPEKALRRGVESANLNIYKKSQSLGTGRMGTTVTAAYIVEDRLHLAHVGDSRAYLVRNRQASCLTNDHTVVGDMARARLISADKVRSHAQRSILTRAVGIGLFVQPDLTQIRLQKDDRIILCSDGVWSTLLDEDFGRAASNAWRAELLARHLVDLAIKRESDDNCSVVVLHLRGFEEQALPISPDERSNEQGIASILKKMRGRVV